MKYSNKIQIIQSVLDEDYPPVMTMKQIARISHLSYSQVKSTLTLYFYLKRRKSASTLEIVALGSHYQMYFYSTKRCVPKVMAKL